MPKISFEERWVTPENARDYLGKQIPNRHLSFPVAYRYARDMVDGHWKDTGEVIKLNPENFMLDGQHRMQAILLAAELAKEERKKFDGVYLMFAVGVPNEARQAMDIGRKRNVADQMSFEGGKDVNRVSPIANWHLAYIQGNFTNASGAGRYKPTQAEVLEHWRANYKLFQTTTARAVDAYKQGLGAPAPFGVAYHVLRLQFGDDLTEKFFSPLISGVGLNERSPILALRNRLIAGIPNKRDRHYILALIFKAWNAWIDDRPVDTLYFKSPPTNSNFPLPRDPKNKRKVVVVIDGEALADDEWDEVPDVRH